VFPHGSVVLDSLGREKVEACIFLNHIVPNIVPGLAHMVSKEDALLLLLLCLLSRVLLDTYTTFHVYYHVWIQIIWYSLSAATTASSNHLTSPQTKFDAHFLFSARIWTGDPWNRRKACYQLSHAAAVSVPPPLSLSFINVCQASNLNIQEVNDSKKITPFS
jgi:hypothetical protein